MAIFSDSTFVSRNKLVGEGYAGHEASLLEPEDGGKGAGEKDAFDGGESDDSNGVGRIGTDPLQCPISLLLDSRHRLDRVEESHLLFRVVDQILDQLGVHLRVDVFHHDLVFKFKALNAMHFEPGSRRKSALLESEFRT